MRLMPESSPSQMNALLGIATCPICTEIVQDAFLTPCGHTFCYACIQRHLKTGVVTGCSNHPPPASAAGAAGPPPPPPSASNQCCPQCGSHLTADMLVPNLLLSRVIREASELGRSEMERNVTRMRDVMEAGGAGETQEEETEEEEEAALVAGGKRRRGKKASGGGIGEGRDRFTRTLELVNSMTLEEMASVESVLASRRTELESEFSAGGIELLSSFLVGCRERKRDELQILHMRLSTLDAHISTVEDQQMVTQRQQEGMEKRAASSGSVMNKSFITLPHQRVMRQQNKQQEAMMRMESNEEQLQEALTHNTGLEVPLPRHPTTEIHPMATTITTRDDDERKEKQLRIQQHTDDLRDIYRKCAADGSGLAAFSNTLSTFLKYTRLRCIAELPRRDSGASSSIVSSIEFDAMESRFATAGVSKHIRVYSLPALVDGEEEGGKPVLDLRTRSKLSCLSWCKFSQHELASSDYEGIVSVWDVETATAIQEFEEHQKRVWTIDYARTAGPMLVSGSDDGCVKIWSTSQPSSICTIDMHANVCCVKYNAATHQQIAIGCADHNVHIYDLRQTSKPLQVLWGHRKAVSYVKYQSSTEVVSASTDGTLRVWDVGGKGLIRTLQGHTNEKNFVGLSVSSEFVSCGSETNDVFVYYKEVSGPILRYNFDKDDCTVTTAARGEPGTTVTRDSRGRVGGAGGPTASVSRGASRGAASNADLNQFISSICFKGESPLLVAANSQGAIRVLSLE